MSHDYVYLNQIFFKILTRGSPTLTSEIREKYSTKKTALKSPGPGPFWEKKEPQEYQSHPVQEEIIYATIFVNREECMIGYAGSRDSVGTRSLRGGPHTYPHIPLKSRTPILSLQTPTLSQRVLCSEHPHRLHADCRFPT